MQSYKVVVFGVLYYSVLLIVPSTQALECSVLLNDTSKDLSQVIATCLIPTIPVVEEKPENVTQVTNATNEDDPEELPSYGPRRGLRVRRQNENTATTSLSPGSYSSNASNNNSNNNASKNDTDANPNDPARCVVHCIMTTYNMIGAKGFPELTKVAASLMKDITVRELRDFLQDSVDECFQKLSESSQLDSCTYSARLATCLADKARFNCSDWPVGELPFPHKF